MQSRNSKHTYRHNYKPILHPKKNPQNYISDVAEGVVTSSNRAFIYSLIYSRYSIFVPLSAINFWCANSNFIANKSCLEKKKVYGASFKILTSLCHPWSELFLVHSGNWGRCRTPQPPDCTVTLVLHNLQILFFLQSLSSGNEKGKKVYNLHV